MINIKKYFMKAVKSRFGTEPFSRPIPIALTSFWLLASFSRAQITYRLVPLEILHLDIPKRKMLAEGVGLDYAVAGGECGQPMTVTLPPGAVPVTAFAYVEYDIGSEHRARPMTAPSILTVTLRQQV